MAYDRVYRPFQPQDDGNPQGFPCCLGYGGRCPVSWDCPQAQAAGVRPDRLLSWGARHGDRGVIGVERSRLWPAAEADGIEFLAWLWDRGEWERGP